MSSRPPHPQNQSESSFEPLLRRVQRLLSDYERSGDPSVILRDGPVADTAALADALRSAAVSGLAPQTRPLFHQACHALGWLYYYQFNVSPRRTGLANLANAALFLGVTDDRLSIPEPMQKLVGPAAVVETQAGLAGELLTQASE